METNRKNVGKMTILIVDDNRRMRMRTRRVVNGIVDNARIICMDNPLEALLLARHERIDVALLDVVMPQMHGIRLAQEIEKCSPRVNIILMAESGEYMQDAFQIHVSGYLIKPVLHKSMEDNFDNLRYPVAWYGKKKRRGWQRILDKISVYNP